MAVMTAQRLIDALDLPSNSRVDQRVPKKLLLENASPTAADKRQINDDIEEIQWVAALKPNTIGVSDYRDDVREYLEIAVLAVTQRTTNANPTKVSRIHELVHRAVPYPVLLLLKSDPSVMVSLAHKRWAQNEAGKVVLDGGVLTVAMHDDAPEVFSAFLRALSIARQPRTNLRVLYQGWLDTLAAYQAAQITGVFAHSKTDEQASARRASLLACRELEQQIATLRAAATKEKQLARQVALNLEIKSLQAQMSEALTLL